MKTSNFKKTIVLKFTNSSRVSRVTKNGTPAMQCTLLYSIASGIRYYLIQNSLHIKLTIVDLMVCQNISKLLFHAAPKYFNTIVFRLVLNVSNYSDFMFIQMSFNIDTYMNRTVIPEHYKHFVTMPSSKLINKINSILLNKIAFLKFCN